MKRLYRSKKNRMIAGVCGGMAEYFDVDVTLVRLLWVLAVLIGGGGIIAYIIAMIIIPEEPETEMEPSKEPGEIENQQARERRRRIAGLLLIGLGIIFLAHQVLPWSMMRFWWPLLLIILGIFVLFRDRKGTD